MATQDFNLASSHTASMPSPYTAGEVVELWSGSIAQGNTYPSVSCYVHYESISPDTDVVSPFDFALLAVLEQEQGDGSYQEVGRQNVELRKLEQGAVRQIVVSPTMTVDEEGVDQVIAGFGGVPQRLKSRFTDESHGSLRVRLLVVDNDPTGPNPFQSVTFSVNGQRY